MVTRVPCATREEMNSAVDAAASAFESWKDVSILSRQQIMFKLQHIIRNNMVRALVREIFNVITEDIFFRENWPK